MLEECLLGTKRTRRAADRRQLTAGEWTEEREDAWERVQEPVAQVISLFHRKGGYQVVVFTDASDMNWGGCVTQVAMAVFYARVAGADMSHGRRGFVSGAFRNAQVRWPIVGKEAFSIVSTYRRLEYLLWEGFAVYCNHRSLSYIFHLGATSVPPSKVAAQRLQGWSAYLGQFKYTVMHLAGTENVWGDLLSRWVLSPVVTQPRVVMDAAQLFDGEEVVIPGREAVQESQASVAGNFDEIDTSFGPAVRGADGLHCVAYAGWQVL